MSSRVYPELNLLDSERARREVSRIAHRSVMWTRRFWLSWLGAAVTAVSAMVFILGVVTPWLRQHVSLPDWLVKFLLAFLVTGIVAGGWQFNLRRPMRRHIRRQLLERGIPVCMGCGYSLQGQTTRRCPECGRAVDPTPSGHGGSP